MEKTIFGSIVDLISRRSVSHMKIDHNTTKAKGILN
jgi:hypothetical protein